MGRFSLPKTEDRYKISEESAEAAVNELIQYYAVDIDAIPGRKDRADVEAAVGKLVGYYRLGLLENLREGGGLKVKQHFSKPPGEVREITYKIGRAHV